MAEKPLFFFRQNEIHDGLAEDFLAGESEQITAGIVDLGKPPFEIGHEDAVRRELDERMRTRALLFQFDLSNPQGGEICDRLQQFQFGGRGIP